jgi:ankyrin repeat protein
MKLIESGLENVNALNCDQRTPLHYAVMHNHFAVVQTLLQCPELDVNVQDRFGSTPLHCIGSDSHSELVRILLQHPFIEINLQDEDGWTALTTAVDCGHADAVHLLLAHKTINVFASRVGEPGFWESIPAQVHPEGKYMTLPPDLHLQLGIKPSLYLAANAGNKDMVELLLQQSNTDPNARYGNYERTALHGAVLGRHLNVVEALLLHPQVNVNSANKYGWTSLMCAVNRGYIDIVNALLRHSTIDINQSNHRGWTALTEAVDEGHTELVQIFLSHKDIDITASRVCIPGFWELNHGTVCLSCKHMTLPDYLIMQLGIHTCLFTDLEIELFSGSECLVSGVVMAKVDGE